MDYKAELKLTNPGGTSMLLTGTLSDGAPPNPSALDFSANFEVLPADTVMMTGGNWNDVFAEAISKGVQVYCLEQNTDATRHDFTIVKGGRNGGNCMRVFMPKGSYGMGHRSVNLTLGPVNGAVNVAFDFMVEKSSVNLFTAGGGKWGPAIQYGPIQSGSTGGIRFMPTWSGGASTLGKQDLTVSIQNQPDGGQWLQPPYYGFRPIEPGHWYDIRLRMTGGVIDAPSSVLCEYWKDDDPPFSYQAATDNPNVLQGKASVLVDWTCFFGGTAANAAPADAYFRYGEKFRVWVE